MSHTILRPFISKVSVLGYFPLSIVRQVFLIKKSISNRIHITHTLGTDGIPSSLLALLSNELRMSLYFIFNS